MIKYLEDNQLADIVENRDDMIIIDIRSPAEHQREHIPGSINLTIEELASPTPTTWADKTLVFHCQSGMRTKQAEPILSQINCKSIYCLKNGITQWKRCKHPITKQSKQPIDIMRQVQIIAGSMVLLGILLAFTISHFFIILSAVMGAGILFAGIIGACPMADLLLKLPFNQPKKS